VGSSKYVLVRGYFALVWADVRTFLIYELWVYVGLRVRPASSFIEAVPFLEEIALLSFYFL
jgi:hypothetical protein